MLDFLIKHAPSLWYLTGCLCFVIGTILSMVRAS